MLAKRKKAAGHTVAVDDSASRQYAHRQQAGLKRVLKLRREAELALEKTIASSSEGRRMREEAKELVTVLADACRRMRAGKTSRRQIESEYGQAARAFETKYRRVAEDAWLKVADRAPAASRVYRELHSRRPPSPLSVQLVDFLGFIFPHVPQKSNDDTASTAQALLPPLDVPMCSFSLHLTQDHTDAAGGIGFMPSYVSPSGGFFSETPSAPAFDNIPGVASSRALLGAEFTFPDGYTSFTISADIDWNYSMSTWVVFGGAGCGIDLVLRVEPAGGVNPTEKLQGLASVVAPVLWGATADGSGSSTIALTLDLNGAAARDFKVFAGAASHAEAEGTAGISMANISGTVKCITVHAE